MPAPRRTATRVATALARGQLLKHRYALQQSRATLGRHALPLIERTLTAYGAREDREAKIGELIQAIVQSAVLGSIPGLQRRFAREQLKPELRQSFRNVRDLLRRRSRWIVL